MTGTMNKVWFWTIAVIFYSFFCGYLGHRITQTHCDLVRAQNELSAAEVYSDALAKKNEEQLRINEANTKAQIDLVSSVQEIDSNYSRLFDVSIDVKPDGVHFGTRNSDSEKGNMSDSSAPAVHVQAAPCKCSSTDGAKFQRLYKQQLAVSKDCDITTAYYNTILKMYEVASSK